MQKPERHVWEEGSTHRAVAGKEYDEVWDYAEALEAKAQQWEDVANKHLKRAWGAEVQVARLLGALERIAHNPMPTWTDVEAEEFFRQFAADSDVTVAQLREWGQEVFPCDCDYEGCEGWQVRNKKDYERDLRVIGGKDACEHLRRMLEQNERLRYDSKYFNEQWCFANAGIAGLKVKLDQLQADRDALVAGLKEYYEVIELWSKAYPTDVFPEPPKGEHGKTVDACSAAMGRHIFKRLMEDWEKLVMQALSDELKELIDEG